MMARVRSRRGDIPFGKDPASRMLPWIVAVMVYIAALAIAGAFVLAAFAARWEAGLAGAMTIQIPPAADAALEGESREAMLEEALQAVRETPGIAGAEMLATAEMRRLLEPWLGSGIDPRDLPLPALISAELAEGVTVAQIDQRDLARRLQAVAPGALIDDHGQWQARLVAFMGALRLVAAVLVGVVTVAGLAMVIFGTRSGLMAHRQTIELLHLFGAEDGYIARQFQSEAMRAGFKGGLVGVLAAALTVLALGQGAAATGAVLPGAAVLAPFDWAVLAGLPVVSAAIALLAARVTVMRALARMV
jgi:cell division transport system permease protein